MSIRALARTARRRGRRSRGRMGRRSRRCGRARRAAVLAATPAKRPSAAARDVFEEDTLDRILARRTRGSARGAGRRCAAMASRRSSRIGSRAMPIHVRAEPGDYAEAVPAARRPAAGQVHRRDLFRRRRATQLRARPARLQRHVGGKAGLRAGHRDGVPRRDDRLRGARPARLQEAPARRHLRRTAAAPQARRHDRRSQRRAGRLHGDAPRRQRAALPDGRWELVHGAVHAAKEIGQPMHVGPIVSSDLFYNPDDGQYERWSKRGVLGRRDGGGRALHRRRAPRASRRAAC